jgi:hypothetical protein
MTLDLTLDPLAAPYTGRMDMTLIGRVNLLDNDPQVPGVFGLLTDPDETTEGSSEFRVMVLANHKPKLRHVSRQLLLGQRVAVHGAAYPHRVDGGLTMCLRADQITPLPRAEEETGPTWARVTVTGQVVAKPRLFAGPRITGSAVTIPVDLSGQTPSTWHLFCYLEGEQAPERAGMTRVAPDACTHDYEPGTSTTAS